MTYITGKPCRRGHVGERYVSTGNCVQCLREKAADRALIADSAKRMRIGTKVSSPQLFAGEVPIKHHERFRQLQQAYVHGNAEWLLQADAAIAAILSTGEHRETGKPFA